jgi:hypothetical protein
MIGIIQCMFSQIDSCHFSRGICSHECWRGKTSKNYEWEELKTNPFVISAPPEVDDNVFLLPARDVLSLCMKDEK